MADFRKRLIIVNRQLEKVERAQMVFLSEAILPVAKVESCQGNPLKIYECLTNSSECKGKAQQLMSFILESVGSPLLPSSESCVTALSLELALHKLLLDVAMALRVEHAQDFIYFAAPDLSQNAQNLNAADANPSVGLLELFKCALERCVISANDVSKLKEWLKEIKAESTLKVVQEFEKQNLLPAGTC